MKLKKFYVFLIQFFKELETKRHQVRKTYLENYRKYGRFLYTLSGFVSLFILIIEFGFFYPEEWKEFLKLTITYVVLFFLFYEFVSITFTSLPLFEYLLNHKIEIVIITLVFLEIVFEEDLTLFLKQYHLTSGDSALVFLSVTQILFLFSNLAHFFRLSHTYDTKKLNPSILFVFSFAAIIGFGILFLMFPKSTTGEVKFIDILFTTISATCVTGLSTINISNDFTFSGQLVILFLIQIGGLGLMTLTSFFSIFLAGKVSVKDTLLIKDLLSEETMGKAKLILKQITIQTFVIESIGAILLFFHIPDNINLSITQKIYYAIFHSISAFCNAGFSLFENGLQTEGFLETKGFLSVIMLLIVFGGLGFPVILQLKNRLIRWNDPSFRFSVSTKLVLFSSSILWILGFLSYFFLETNNSLAGLEIDNQIFHSLFYSVTTRTAGFNTLELTQMGIPITFVSLFLMWVGASPISTGGGIKTTTIALSFLNILNQIRGKERMEIQNRTVAPSSINRAGATIVLSLFVIFFAIFLLVLTEKIPFLDLCFEVVSAFGTVGLTRGVTVELSENGKLVICFVMFIGRVGILTLLVAFAKKAKHLSYKYPEEYVVVG
ncbi:potassium transporter TrkG [Leptospira sp. 96542]|nr:potassium transporter TrkG [Leptospira sp. 96542]